MHLAIPGGQQPASTPSPFSLKQTADSRGQDGQGPQELSPSKRYKHEKVLVCLSLDHKSLADNKKGSQLAAEKAGGIYRNRHPDGVDTRQSGMMKVDSAPRGTGLLSGEQQLSKKLTDQLSLERQGKQPTKSAIRRLTNQQQLDVPLEQQSIQMETQDSRERLEHESNGQGEQQLGSRLEQLRKEHSKEQTRLHVDHLLKNHAEEQDGLQLEQMSQQSYSIQTGQLSKQHKVKQYTDKQHGPWTEKLNKEHAEKQTSLQKEQLRDDQYGNIHKDKQLGLQTEQLRKGHLDEQLGHRLDQLRKVYKDKQLLLQPEQLRKGTKGEQLGLQADQLHQVNIDKQLELRKDGEKNQNESEQLHTMHKDKQLLLKPERLCKRQLGLQINQDKQLAVPIDQDKLQLGLQIDQDKQLAVPIDQDKQLGLQIDQDKHLGLQIDQGQQLGLQIDQDKQLGLQAARLPKKQRDEQHGLPLEQLRQELSAQLPVLQLLPQLNSALSYQSSSLVRSVSHKQENNHILRILLFVLLASVFIM